MPVNVSVDHVIWNRPFPYRELRRVNRDLVALFGGMEGSLHFLACADVEAHAGHGLHGAVRIALRDSAALVQPAPATVLDTEPVLDHGMSGQPTVELLGCRRVIRDVFGMNALAPLLRPIRSLGKIDVGENAPVVEPAESTVLVAFPNPDLSTSDSRVEPLLGFAQRNFSAFARVGVDRNTGNAQGAPVIIELGRPAAAHDPMPGPGGCAHTVFRLIHPPRPSQGMVFRFTRPVVGMNVVAPAGEVSGTETRVDAQHRTPVVVPINLIARQIVFPKAEIRTVQREREVRGIRGERRVLRGAHPGSFSLIAAPDSRTGSLNSWRAFEKSRGSIAKPADTQASRVVRNPFW